MTEALSGDALDLVSPVGSCWPEPHLALRRIQGRVFLEFASVEMMHVVLEKLPDLLEILKAPQTPREILFRWSTHGGTSSHRRSDRPACLA
jgi:hypothetical protein